MLANGRSWGRSGGGELSFFSLSSANSTTAVGSPRYHSRSSEEVPGLRVCEITTTRANRANPSSALHFGIGGLFEPTRSIQEQDSAPWIYLYNPRVILERRPESMYDACVCTYVCRALPAPTHPSIDRSHPEGNVHLPRGGCAIRLVEARR